MTDTQRRSLLVLATILGLPLACLPALAQEASLLRVGIMGSTGNDLPDYLDPFIVLGERPVQELLLEIAESPRDAAFLDQRLAGARFTRAQLEELGVVRKSPAGYVVGFSFFTQSDNARIQAVAEGRAATLAASFERRWPELDRIFARYDAERVSKKDLGFFLVGCMTLDWDGLALTLEKGYRTEEKPQANGGAYVLWAIEEGGPPIRGLYWGSHNIEVGEWTLTSFGDHFSLPRLSFPDLTGRISREIRDTPLGEELETPLQHLSFYMSTDLARDVARTMTALRDGPKTAGEIAAVLGVSEGNADWLLEFLAAVAYVEASGDRFAARVPVLTEQDRRIVEEVRNLGREIMGEWLAENYTPVREELAGITSLRQGVEYGEVFTQVWHYVFGIAVRDLATAGLVTDPYEKDPRLVGFVPAVWHSSLE